MFFKKPHLSYKKTDLIKNSIPFDNLTDYMIEKGYSFESFLSPDVIKNIDVVKYTIANWLLTKLKASKTVDETHQYLWAATQANQDAELVTGNTSDLNKILDLGLWWETSCNQLVAEYNKVPPERLATTKIFGKVLRYSKLGECIIDCHNQLNGIQVETDSYELQDRSHPTINTALLEEYIQEKNNSSISGSGITGLNLHKCVIARWLYMKLRRMQWADKNLPAVLIATSEMNEKLESSKEEYAATLNTLEEINAASCLVYSVCKNLLTQVQQDFGNTSPSSSNSDETVMVPPHFEPTVILSNIFGFESDLSKHITEIYETMQSVLDTDKGRDRTPMSQG